MKCSAVVRWEWALVHRVFHEVFSSSTVGVFHEVFSGSTVEVDVSPPQCFMKCSAVVPWECFMKCSAVVRGRGR